MDFDKPKVYGDTSIADGLVIVCVCVLCVGTYVRELRVCMWRKVRGYSHILVDELGTKYLATFQRFVDANQ